MKKLLITLCAALLGAAGTPAAAGELIDVSVVSRVSGRLSAWHQHGRSYVAGAPGERYSLRLTNRSGSRVLAVVSVDGVNVVTGETASPAQSGYVLDPGGSVDIRGWRKSMGEVAAFYFTALGDSYAARTGRPDEVGVIGVAAFRELPPPPPVRLHRPSQAPGALGAPAHEARADADGAGEGARNREHSARDSAASSAPLRAEEKLGTGHGEREASQARWTQFRRASANPDELIAIHYDSRANLVARGIIPPTYAVPAPRQPDPFPAFRFVPEPRG